MSTDAQHIFSNRPSFIYNIKLNIYEQMTEQFAKKK